MSDGFVTVAQCVEGLPLGRCVWEILICAWLAWFLLGALNESSPLAFSMLSTSWHMSERNAMMMSAALAFGNVVAILVGGYLADRWGRLSVIRPALFLTACGMILLCSQTFIQAILTRFTLGLFSGGLLCIVPPLVAEFLPSKDRGFYLTIWCCGWPVGALFSLTTVWLLPGLDWRLFYTIMLVPATILYACTKADMMPESPRWLYLAGRRDEGYEGLMDMYDKQMLPLPWAPETIAVKSGQSPSRAARASRCSSCTQGAGTALWLALAMFSVSAASQSMKLWMPAMLMAEQADDVASAKVPFPSIGVRPFHFASGPRAMSLLNVVHAPLMMSSPNNDAVVMLMHGYLVQFLGMIGSAYLSQYFSRRSMVQWSLLIAAALTVSVLTVAEGGLTTALGPLVGLQLAASATAFNFLQAFVCEFYPTQRRAKACAFAFFAAHLGNFVIPVVGGFVVRRWSAYNAVILFGALYLVGWGAALMLPLPSAPEEPIHDLSEPMPRKGAAMAAKKRGEWFSYQTL